MLGNLDQSLDPGLSQREKEILCNVYYILGASAMNQIGAMNPTWPARGHDTTVELGMKRVQ